MTGVDVSTQENSVHYPGGQTFDLGPGIRRGSGGWCRATVKKGISVALPEWWKRLRWTRRAFWKCQRQADKREGHEQQCARP